MTPDGGAPLAGTVVIGVGSPLMGDDGLGLAALEELRAIGAFEPHVELLDGGTWGMNILPFLETAERVLILDAIDADREAGEVVELEGDDLPRFFSTKLSPHQIDLKEVLALAELRGTLPEVVALGIQPASIEMRAEVSTLVAGAMPRLIETAMARLAAWGHAPADRDRRAAARSGSPAGG